MSPDSRDRDRPAENGGREQRRPKSPRAKEARGLRRRMTDRWFEWQEREALWLGLLVLVGFWVVTPGELFTRRAVTVGEVSRRDFVADRDLQLLDEATTTTRRDAARDSVLPVYDFDPTLLLDISREMSSFFSAGRELLAEGVSLDPVAPESVVVAPGAEELEVGDESPFVAALRDRVSLRMTREEIDVFVQVEFSEELEDRVLRVIRSLLTRGVVANKSVLLENQRDGVTLRELGTGHEERQRNLYNYLEYPDEVRQFIDDDLSRSGWRSPQRPRLAQFVLENVPPNVSLNLEQTGTRRQAAADAVEQSYTLVRAGQVIARRGDQLSETAVRLIDEMRGQTPETPGLSMVVPLLGNLLLMLLVAIGIEQGHRHVRFLRVADRRTLAGVILLLIGALIATQLGMVLCSALSESFERAPLDDTRSYMYALPFASLPLLISLFYGRGRALLVTVFYALVVGRIVPEQASALSLFVLFTSLAAIYTLDSLHQRSAITRAALLVAATGTVSSLMVGTLAEAGVAQREPLYLLFDAAMAAVGGVLVAAATSFMVPVLESMLGLTTDIKLLELSDTNLPLLRRVAFEAPGTFQHSLMVANLAKAGSEAIGANAVLAYTGGLYHDIGKVLRPGYFVENQWEGENPHDKLQPSMSSLIVINHVKEGVELAKETGLPDPILDAIRQHHGTRRLTYFYNRAKEMGGGAEVDEQSYRYPGPRPQNKVMGILMCADAIEAASRTLKDPSSVAIRSLIDRLVGEAVSEGELDECDLTLDDLRLMKEAFSKVLQRIYHKRIDYPGYDFNKRKERALRVVEGRP